MQRVRALPASSASCARLTCRDCSQPVFAALTSSSVKPSFSARAISSLNGRLELRGVLRRVDGVHE